jgi:hypothetical protein
LSSPERRPTAAAAVGGFSPLDLRLALGAEGYSPALLAKIEFAGANAPSFPQGARFLEVLSDLAVSPKHLQRITERLGAEREQSRDVQAEAFRSGKLKPVRKEPPAVVAVHVDAGKAQFREDDGAPGVRRPRWGDVKVACLATYASAPSPRDPQPEPPAVFLDPPAVARLCAEIERVRSRDAPNPQPSPLAGPSTPAPEEPSPAGTSPTPLVRTAVATLGNTERFGLLVAAEAQRRGFYGAARRAVVGDGGNWIGPLARLHFPGWCLVLDFLHLLVHLYAAAKAAFSADPRRAWQLYEALLREAWAGRPAAVLARLGRELVRLRVAKDRGSRPVDVKTLELTVAYVQENTDRMRYDVYRRQGLPVTSALVESLIKQVNQRIKGTEKFWTAPRLEAVLQSRAAYLSEDDRAPSFFASRRPGSAVGPRRLPRAA